MQAADQDNELKVLQQAEPSSSVAAAEYDDHSQAMPDSVEHAQTDAAAADDPTQPPAATPDLREPMAATADTGDTGAAADAIPGGTKRTPVPGLDMDVWMSGDAGAVARAAAEVATAVMDSTGSAAVPGANSGCAQNSTGGNSTSLQVRTSLLLSLLFSWRNLVQQGSRHVGILIRVACT